MHLYAVDELVEVSAIKVCTSYSSLEKHVAPNQKIAIYCKECYVAWGVSGYKQNIKIMFANIQCLSHVKPYCGFVTVIN